MDSSDRCFVWYFFARGQLLLAFILTVLCTICALLIGLNENNGDPKQKIIKAEEELKAEFKNFKSNSKFDPDAYLRGDYDPPPWKKVEEIARSLSWYNEDIFKAKAMVYFQQNPSPHDSYDWDRRFETSQKPWAYYETSDRLTLMLTYSISTFLISLICFIVFFGLLKWGWYFFLDRLREIASSIRGNK